MSRRINTLLRFSGVLFFVVAFVLSGFPTTPFVDMWSDRNVIDQLYLSIQHPDVIDIGMANLARRTIPRAHAATFSMQTGYYVGNNSDNRSISGVGFSPDLVLLKDNTTGGTEGAIIKTSSMAGELSLALSETDAALSTNHIQSLDADGFTLGTDADVNGGNVSFFWAAFDGSDCSASGTFCVGSYTGNGTSQNITSVGFQPDLVIVKRNGASVGVWRSSSMGANTSNFFHNLNQDATGAYISGLLSNGFSVGSNASVNTSGQTYYYAAFKQVSGAMDVGTFTGNAADNRNITSTDDAGLTFKPNLVFVKNSNNTTAQNGVFSVSENYGDRSQVFTDTASAANQIQELRSAGGFQVGTNATVNGSGNAIYYAAFGGASNKAAGSGSFTMTNGSYTGTGSGFSVTGLGFAPDVVIIKHNDQTTDQYAVFRTSVMGGDTTAYMAAATANFTGGITALGSDGFTVGTAAQVNTSGDTYYWTAFGNAWRPDKSGGAADFAVGSYIGDGIDSRNVDRLPFQPDLVAIKRSGASVGTWTTSNVTAANSLFFSATAQAANYIQSLNSDGFQRGTNASVNTSGNTYNYFMFDAGGDFVVSNYTGNGSTQNITSVGFQPDMVWTKKSTGGTARGGVFRTSAQTGDATQPFLNTATVANGFTNLLVNGFSLGTLVEANENTGVYRYAAWNAKTYEQSAYRFFLNADATSVGMPLAAQDTAATLTATGDKFRLRALVEVQNGNLFASGQDFKLQFIDKSGSLSCASASGGTPSSWTDVTSGTIIAFNDNTPADGAALTSTTTDPTHSLHTIVNQTYEEANNFTNTQAAINKAQDGKWDFSLYDNGAAADTTYCLRIVKSDGTVLETYTQYPEVTTAAGGGNSLPVASGVSIEEGAASIVPNEGTTKNVSCVGTVTDTNGFSDIAHVGAFFFRTSVGTSSPMDENNKYYLQGDSSCVPSGGSGNSETYTCAFPVAYYADATDAGSPNSGDNWTCEMWPADTVATGTPATDGIEMNSLIALDVDPSLDYGSLNPGSNTGQGDIKISIDNTGNRDIDPEISGANMTSGGNTIVVGQQKYADFNFDYGTQGTALSTTPTAIDITLPQRTTATTTDDVWFGIGVPTGTVQGTYTGTNTVTAAAGL